MTDSKTEERFTGLENGDDQPPVLGSWNRLYAFVLILHLTLIALLYYITILYS